MFQESCRRTSVAVVLTFAMTSIVLGAGNVSLPDAGKRTEQVSKRRVAPAAEEKPLTPEQVRVQDEAECHIDTARLAMRARDVKRGLQNIAEARKLLEAADLMAAEQRYVVDLINGVLEIHNGRLNIAEGLMTDAAGIAATEFGENTPAYALAISYLAFVEASTGNPQSAERRASRAVEIYRAAPPAGDDHFVALRLLRDFSVSRKEYDAALEFQREIMRSYVAAMTTETADYAAEQVVVAKIEVRRENFVEARNSLNTAMELYEKTLGSDAAPTRETAEWLEQVVARIQNETEIRRAQQEVDELGRRADGCQGPWKKRDEMALRHKQLEIVRKHITRPNIQLFEYLSAMVVCHIKYSEYTKALRIAEECLEMAEAIQADGQRIGNVLMYAGFCEMRLRRLTESRKYLLKAEEILPEDARTTREGTEELLMVLDYLEQDFPATLKRATAAIDLLQVDPDKNAANILMLRMARAIVLSESPVTFDRSLAEMSEILRDYQSGEKSDATTLLALKQRELLLMHRCGDRRCADLAFAHYDECCASDVCNDKCRIGAGVLVAECCRAFQRTEDAKRIAAEILPLTEESLDFDMRWNRAMCFHLMAGIEAHAGHRREAEAYFREAIGLITELKGPDDQRTLKWVQELADYEAGKLPSFAAKDNPMEFEFTPYVTP